MVLFRAAALAFLLAAGCAWTADEARAGGGELPSLAPSVLYGGESEEDGVSYCILLSLQQGRGFALRETFSLPNGKGSSWETTGLWYQVRDGAFVQLTNVGGFYRLLNVGGAGDLYMGLRFPTGRQAIVPLRVREELPMEFTVTGILRVTPEAALLEDEASGIAHTLRPGEVLAAFLKERQAGTGAELPVRATVTLDADFSPALRVSGIRGIPAKKRTPPDLVGYFQSAVGGGRWKVTRWNGAPPPALWLVSFLPDRSGRYADPVPERRPAGREERGGKLEIFDGSVHVTGRYTLRAQDISLSAEPEDQRLAGLVARVRSWRLAGEVLELLDETGASALLEKPRE